MIKYTSLFFFMVLFNAVNAQCDKSLAKVYRFAGKDVYYNSDPVKKYTVVYELNTTLPAPTFQQVFNVGYAVNFVLEQAKLANKTDGKPYDAIITVEGSDKDVAIKFEQQTDSTQSSLTHVRRSGDKFVFVLCEPVCPYDVAFEIKAKPRFPVSIVNTVMKKVNRKKLFGKRPAFDAVIIGNDKIHYAIKFK
ncbi:MAG: hypothetical protein V2A54_06765 [Bacteroidota bacterium]